MEQIEGYLADIIRPLITKPEAVKIVLSSDNMGVLLSLTVAKEDMGSLVGKEGETVKAVRQLVRIAGVKNGARVSIRVTEPDGSIYLPHYAINKSSN